MANKSSADNYSTALQYVMKQYGLDEGAARDFLAKAGTTPDSQLSDEQLRDSEYRHSESGDGNNAFETIFDPKAQARRDAAHEAGNAKTREDDLLQKIPGLAKDGFVDPYKDVEYFNPGSPLDLTNAKTDLYNPEGTTRDLTGRGYQQDSANYLGGVMQSGHDAASDAYYEQKRAQAAQAGRAQRQAGVQQLQQRGMYNGGAGIMNELYAARSVGSDTHTAALGAAAQAQNRKDSAAGARANIGAGIQSGDDSWGKWFEGEMANHGRDKSNLDQNADVANYNRTNQTSDTNTKLRDDLILRNKQLPWDAFNAERGVTNDKNAAGASKATADVNAVGPSPYEVGGELISKGAQVAQLVSGGASTPHFDTNTGKPLYDPETGKAYT